MEGGRWWDQVAGAQHLRAARPTAAAQLTPAHAMSVAALARQRLRGSLAEALRTSSPLQVVGAINAYHAKQAEQAEALQNSLRAQKQSRVAKEQEQKRQVQSKTKRETTEQ